MRKRRERTVTAQAQQTRARRAVVKALELLGLTYGMKWVLLQACRWRAARLLAERDALRLQMRTAERTIELLQHRLDRVPARHRPHYDPESRFRILALKHLLGTSIDQVAKMFRVAPQTLKRWEAEFSRAPEKETIGMLVRPTPPIRRYADVVRHLVQTMAWAGFPGNKTIAQTLARAGWKLSARTVGRIRNERKWRLPPEPVGKTGTVTARGPNHVLMTDLTDLPRWLRLRPFKLAVVLDVFSRMPVAAEVFDREPSATHAANLVRRARRRTKAARHLISDQGPQWTARRFRRTLVQLGLRHRFGAIGRTGSLALIERFWRTLKEIVQLRFRPALVRRELQQRIALGLVYYAHLRPHQGLGGATPAEVHHERTPAHLAAAPPPRGQPGEKMMALAVTIRYLDPDAQRLPYLAQAA